MSCCLGVCEACLLCVVGGKLNAINGQIEIQIGSKITVVDLK